MYRNAAQNYGQVKCIPPNALPSPDHTSDSDCDILDVLEGKRRELDDEVARFKAAKDREFREFEKELRVKRKRSRAGTGARPVSEPTSARQFTSTSSATASVLNLLASAQNGTANGWAGSKARKDGSSGDKVKIPAPLSGPTLSLDKLNIKGETTPPLHSLGTPPTPTLLKRTRYGSPTNPAFRSITPPSSQSEKEPAALSTPTPSKDRSDPFAGVFTPAYLPLLESRDKFPTVLDPPAMNEADEEKKRLQLDLASKDHAEAQKLESSQSLPPQQVSPTLLANKRTVSSPILPSASLPSALRSGNGGGGGPRKHVMFQLADLAVVDPSSSYEEGPSPELEGRDAIEEHGFRALNEQRDEASRKSAGSPRMLGDKDKRSRKGRNGRFVSPMPSPLASPNPSPIPSPALRESSPTTSPTPSPGLTPSVDDSSFSGGLSGADDGGSGVGFFELDEELASPGLREGAPVDSFDLDIPEEPTEKTDAEESGLGTAPTLQVGSVPINIIKPSSSFVGSYGH